MTEQTGLDDLNYSEQTEDAFYEFAENPDPRSACVICLDCSDSMAMTSATSGIHPEDPETPMYKLNQALETLITEVQKDDLTRSRLELTFLPYGTEVNVPSKDQLFKSVDKIDVPKIEPMQLTSTGAVLNTAMDLIRDRKAEYNRAGIDYYRPFLVIITDGNATDNTAYEQAKGRLNQMEAKSEVVVIPVAVNEVAVQFMQGISGSKPPLLLKDTNFSEFFVWLSKSQAAVSASTPGDVPDAPPIDGWAKLV